MPESMPRRSTESRPVCYSRCGHCRSVLPVSVADLAAAGGVVRCGGCGRTLNALATLHDHPPEGDEAPLAVSGMPPLINPRTHQESLPADAVSDPADEFRDPGGPPRLNLEVEPTPPPAWARWLWPLLAVALGALLVLQLAGPERWRVDLSGWGFGKTPAPPPEDALALVSRDMHPHPTLNDAVIVSAMVQNRSRQRIPWPVIEITLLDASQQVVGRRRLRPDEYLDPDAVKSGGLAPEALLPVIVELPVTSTVPQGFAMTFHPAG